MAEKTLRERQKADAKARADAKEAKEAKAAKARGLGWARDLNKFLGLGKRNPKQRDRK